MAEDRAVRTGVMSTDHGRIVLSVPDRLSEADLADFEAWIALVIRGMRRRVSAGAAKDGGGADRQSAVSLSESSTDQPYSVNGLGLKNSDADTTPRDGGDHGR